MVDLVHQYREDLEAQLRHGLTPYEAQMMAEEVEQHLRQRIAASVELGSSPETAQLEAIAAMGPTSQLAQEFGRQVRQPRLLSPMQGNVAMFFWLCIPIIFNVSFIRNDFVNLATIALWFLTPAFCRKWPVLGTLAGIIGLEFILVVTQGNQANEDALGIAIVLALTYASFVSGVGVRWISRRVRARKERRRIS